MRFVEANRRDENEERCAIMQYSERRPHLQEIRN